MTRNRHVQNTQPVQQRPASQSPSTGLSVAEKQYQLAERTYAQAELSAMRDKLRGALALQAMNNVAMLAAAEEHFIQIAPGGADEYRQITRAYAYLAARELIGGDWP